MSTSSNKKSEATMDDVLALISDFKAGNFSKQLNQTSDPKLKDLVDSLNDVTKILNKSRDEEISKIEGLKNQFEAMVQATSDIIYRMSADWSSMLPLDGRALVASNDEPLAGWAWLEQNIPAEEHARIRQAIGVAIAQKAFFSLEHRVLRPDGSIGWTASRAVPILDAHGNVCEWLGAASDISERKQAEEALRRSEAEACAQLREFEQIYAYSPTGLFIFDREYRFQRVNERMAEINGFSVAHHFGKTMDEIAPDLAGFLKEMYRPIFERGEPVLNVEIHGKTPRDPDHECYWIGNYFPLKSETGEVIGLIGAVLDITERKNAEIALQKSEQRLGLALDGGNLGLWDWDALTNKLIVNERWLSMLGLNPSTTIPTLDFWHSLIHPEDMPILQNLIDKVISNPNGKRVEAEVRAKHANGEYIWILDKGSIVSRDNNGNPLRIVGTHMDITKLKQAEARLAQASKLASLGEMSAGIAHEINNPLAIISGSVGHLSKFKDNPEKMASKIEAIQKSCGRIASIVNGLKKFSRSHDRTIFRSHVLIDIVKEVFIMTESSAKSVGTSVIIESSGQTEIMCDEVQIEQVLVNLINNGIDAVKDRQDKWVKISIFEDGNTVVMRVMDSGPGIPEDVRDKLFDPFFTTKKVGEGTGLGLSITKGILDEHKATITLVTDCPHTCFETRFPKAEAMKNAT